MAVSQASIIQSLENLVSDLDQNEFIFSFLDAYGFPKSTITRLRKEGDSRNVAENGRLLIVLNSEKLTRFSALAYKQQICPETN